MSFFIMWESGLMRKLRIIPNFIWSHTGRQVLAIHVLPNISRSKVNQTMKLGRLTQYITPEIFFLKSCTQNVMKKLVPDHFKKNQNQKISRSMV